MRLQVPHRDGLSETLKHLPLGKALPGAGPPLVGRNIPSGDALLDIHQSPLAGKVCILHHRLPAGIHHAGKGGRIGRPHRPQGSQEPLLVLCQFHRSHLLCKVLYCIHLIPQLTKERLHAFICLLLALPAGELASLAPAAEIGKFPIVLEHVEEV
ncbi:MAG: hypothetical protein BWX50_01165 [Euryarchaeota archaeon ADurb.Bin009]|nr:MAG: hypothetical protein BWX50_01165 [Euryarchaeota archaeon ADurb.Bin009]